MSDNEPRTTQVSRSGNSLAVRLPVALVVDTNLL